MPKPIKKVRKRGAPSSDDRDEGRRYFASGGRYYPPGKSEYCWLPFMDHEWQREPVREAWRAVRLLVRRDVGALAFKILSAEFDAGLSRNFTSWPPERLDELQRLTSE